MSHKNDFLKSLRVIDYETTGIDPSKAEVIETGIALYDGSQWAFFNELYSASKPLPLKTQALCLIHPRLLIGKPEFEPRKNDFFEYLTSGYIVAHNAKYERLITKAYNNDIPAERYLCTLKWTKKLFPGLEYYSLPELRYYFDLAFDKPEYDNLQMHRAHHDAYFTGLLAEMLTETMLTRGIVKDTPNLAQDIADWVHAPLIYDVVPFGKHKGEPFSVVPMSYWSWCFENMDQFDDKNEVAYDEDLVSTIEAEIAKAGY